MFLNDELHIGSEKTIHIYGNHDQIRIEKI